MSTREPAARSRELLTGMRIVGHGMIARGFAPYIAEADDLTVFAMGVADSSTADEAAYARELKSLGEALAESASAGRRLVYFSGGGAIYGTYDARRSERSPLAPATAYGRHQAECEALVRSSGARHLIVRLPNVVGAPQNPRQLVPSLVSQALGGAVTLYAHATRDLIDVADVARIVTRAAAVTGDRETIVLASGRSLSVATIFDRIERILGTRALRRFVDAGDRQRFDISRLRELVPDVRFEPHYPDLVLERYVPALAEQLAPGRATSAHAE